MDENCRSQHTENALPPVTNGSTAPAVPRRRSFWQRVLGLVALLLVVYLGLAYLVMPTAWKRYEHRHPSLDDVPGITQTADGTG